MINRKFMRALAMVDYVPSYTFKEFMDMKYRNELYNLYANHPTLFPQNMEKKDAIEAMIADFIAIDGKDTKYELKDCLCDYYAIQHSTEYVSPYLTIYLTGRFSRGNASAIFCLAWPKMKEHIECFIQNSSLKKEEVKKPHISIVQHTKKQPLPKSQLTDNVVRVINLLLLGDTLLINSLNKTLCSSSAKPMILDEFIANKKRIVYMLIGALHTVYNQQPELFPQNITRAEAINSFSSELADTLVDKNFKPSNFSNALFEESSRKNKLAFPKTDLPAFFTEGNSSAIFWCVWAIIQPKINEIWSELLENKTSS